MEYIETPRTDAGNATFMTNGHNLDDFSVENSFVAPSKGNDDLLQQMRKGRGLNPRTPRTRNPLLDRRNPPSQREFTPLLKSVAKNNLNRNNKSKGVPQTPIFLKDGYKGADTPALPGAESSRIYGEETGSLTGGEDDGTPVPQVASSSAQSTPLALPNRDAGGVLTAEGNAMTLREQENIINKIEKENFALKLKIHFLDDALQKAGPGYNAAALKENTNLKVDKITMQKELAHARKTLIRTERELEQYRLHLQEVQKDIQRKHVDEDLRKELESLRADVTAKSLENDRLRQEASQAGIRDQEAEQLRADIEDLEAEIREKDRRLEDHEDEIERLRDRVEKESDELADLREELESERKRNNDLEDAREDRMKQAKQLTEAQEALQEALEAKEQAENDLEELQDEMANKSMHPKGLSRQLEQKASKLRSELADLHTQHSDLQASFETKVNEAERLAEKVRSIEKDAQVRQRRLEDENQILRRTNDADGSKSKLIADQTQSLERELKAKTEEKDLLHSRHDALTAESETLQRDLCKARSKIVELEEDLDSERQHALDNDRQLRSQAKEEINQLSEDIGSLRQELDGISSQYHADQGRWDSQKRDLQSQKERADERSNGLQRTINKLQEAEGSLTTKESKLQQALESETQRHRDETATFERQIQDLNEELSEMRQDVEELQSELTQTQTALQTSTEQQTSLEEKIQALEDEIEVLQSTLDDETETAKNELNAVQQEADSCKHQLYVAKQELSRAEASHAETKAQLSSQQDRVKNESNADAASETRLSKVEDQLQQARSEKQSLQDRLATNNLELHALRTSTAEVSAERDEMKSQLQQMQNLVDETFRLDQEKVDLRTSMIRLENDIGRLREERKGLCEKNQATERELESQIERASTEEGRLLNEIERLQRKLASASPVGSRTRELQSTKQKLQRLEMQVGDLEGQVNSKSLEIETLQGDLDAAADRESVLLQRETTQKDNIRELKHKTARLERQIHEHEVSRLAVDSPRSSINGSARKAELVEVRLQLTDARQQLKDLRTKAKETEQSLQRRLLDSERQAQSEAEAHDQQREQLETELTACRHEISSHTSKSATAEKTITRLRTRISNLEASLQTARSAANPAEDKTMADERADLHEMLTDAKLTAEDLQLQISTRQSLLDAASGREKDLRTQLKRIREERSLQTQRSTALASELNSVQASYEAVLAKLTRKQHQWDEERKAIVSKVRFTNTSISEKGENGQLEKAEKRHGAELRGLATQIQWLRAKLGREEGFRVGLAFEKRWLSMRCDMYEACNKIDLEILTKMGCAPPKRAPPAKKTPTLKVVATMVLAACRMKVFAREWTEQKKLKASLVKGMECMRREQLEKKKIGMGMGIGKQRLVTR